MSCPREDIEVCQGADFVFQYQILQDDGETPFDLTGYDDLRAELRSGSQSPTATLEAAATVTIVGAASNGTVEVYIAHADTYAISEAAGFWTLQLEDTGTPKTRFTAAQGTYTLHPTTIVSP